MMYILKQNVKQVYPAVNFTSAFGTEALIKVTLETTEEDVTYEVK